MPHYGAKTSSQTNQWIRVYVDDIEAEAYRLGSGPLELAVNALMTGVILPLAGVDGAGVAARLVTLLLLWAICALTR